MKLFDAHCHYNDEKFDIDRDMLIKEVHDSGVEGMINAGYSLNGSISAVDLSNKYDFIYATVGISPNDVTEDYVSDIEKIEELLIANLKSGKIVAIGEIGLDYHYDVDRDMQKDAFIRQIKLANKYDFVHAVIGIHPVDIKKYNAEVDKELERLALSEKKVVAIGEIGLDYHWMEDPEEVQKEGFRRQIELAERVKLPIVIHTREALQDTLDILKEYPNVGGILHCYPGSFQAAKPFLDRYYIGVGGTVTFKNNRKTKELVKELPLDRIVLETDCPYLTPVPFRGKRNQPVYTKYVAEEIAAIKGISVEEVIKVTTENAKKIYNL